MVNYQTSCGETRSKELNKFLYEEWVNIDVVVLNHLINSMKSRCLELIQSEGERINY